MYENFCGIGLKILTSAVASVSSSVAHLSISISVKLDAAKNVQRLVVIAEKMLIVTVHWLMSKV